jgi:hypothetical protein
MISSRLPAWSGPIARTFGRVGVGIEVDDGEGIVQGVEDGGVEDSVLASRPVDLHITIS